MRFDNFLGGSYPHQVVTADQERTVNFYMEPPQAQGATPALVPTPGVNRIVDLTSVKTGDIAPGRAHLFESGREFMVVGSSFIELDAVGNATNHGEVGDDPNPATISSNGDGGGQLLITSAGNAFTFTLATNTLAQVTALDGKATMGDYLDGYFLVLDTKTSTLYLSALFDGTSWDTTADFAQRSIASDPWVSMRVIDRYVWLLGEHTSEAWYNAGGSFPLALHTSSLIRYGCAAPWSVAVSENSILWLHSSRFGAGEVIQARGFTPQVVSKFAVSNALSKIRYPEGARGDVYTDRGHTFYLLSVPTGKTTWAFDLSTGEWAERGTWLSAEHEWNAWRPGFFVRAFGEMRCLDSSGSGVYRLDYGNATDVYEKTVAFGSPDPLPLRRLRRAPAINEENRRVSYSYFEVDMESGLGTSTGQGSAPMVMLRFSDDGGKTWSSGHWRSAGKIGEFSHRVKWNRLGQARRRVFEVSMTDPIPYKFTGAYLSAKAEARVA